MSHGQRIETGVDTVHTSFGRTTGVLTPTLPARRSHQPLRSTLKNSAKSHVLNTIPGHELVNHQLRPLRELREEAR